MKLHNIEFFNTPDGEVMIKEPTKSAYELTPKMRDIVSSFLEKIKMDYPLAYQRLCANCNRYKRNLVFYEFRIVTMFIRCNFGTFDTNEVDIDHLGNLNFEEVQCPRRGFCADEGVICKPSEAVQFTSRETTVFRLMSIGLSTNEIADRLLLSPNTVKRHRENIKKKLDAIHRHR